MYVDLGPRADLRYCAGCSKRMSKKMRDKCYRKRFVMRLNNQDVVVCSKSCMYVLEIKVEELERLEAGKKRKNSPLVKYVLTRT